MFFNLSQNVIFAFVSSGIFDSITSINTNAPPTTITVRDLFNNYTGTYNTFMECGDTVANPQNMGEDGLSGAINCLSSYGQAVSDAYQQSLKDVQDCIKAENGRVYITPEAEFKIFSFSIIYNGVYSKFHVNCKGEETYDITLKIGELTINAGMGFGGIGYKGKVYYKGEQITDFTVVVPDWMLIVILLLIGIES